MSGLTQSRVAKDEPVLIYAVAPSRRQRRLALIIAAFLFLAYIIAAPFQDFQLSRVSAFIPIVDTILFLTDVITAALLFAQFTILRSRALLALAVGYLLTGLLIVSHGLTFPGAFTPTGLLGATPQTTIYLYLIWHIVLPCAAIAYGLLKSGDQKEATSFDSTRVTIFTSIGASIVVVCAITWLTTAGAHWLPDIMLDAVQANAIWSYTAPFVILLEVVAIAIVWPRQSSVLDMWLLLVLWAWLIETLLLSTTAYRFSFVWYAGRIYGLLASSFVLFALLAQTTTLYSRLALSIIAQRIDQAGRLIAVDAALSLVSHEIKQPISAIVANSSAALSELRKSEPNIEELKEILRDIISDGFRTSNITGGIRAIFNKSDGGRSLLDLNASIADALILIRAELLKHDIIVSMFLNPKLPPVHANGVQLQQVLLNLLRNAIQSMDGLKTRARLLKVTTDLDPEGILVKIEDSGAGLDPDEIDRIFEPFFTTKSDGAGLGLSICRSIIEDHGGQLRASPRIPFGAIFQFKLPSRID